MTALTSRGFAALASGDWETAELSFTEALRENPYDMEANLGMARMALDAGYPEDVLHFTRIPEIANVHLADLEYRALNSLGRSGEAFIRGLVFLRKHPEESAFRLRLGSDLLADARHAEALEVFREGAEREPRNHLMAGGEAAACHMLGRMDECRSAVERRLELLPDDPIVFSQWIALHAGKASVDNRVMLDISMGWDRRFGKPLSCFKGVRTGSRGSATDGKIRVGFVSSTFQHHANCQFLLPLLEALDREILMVFAYHDGSHHDEVTKRCEASVDMFHRIHGMPEMKVAEMISRDRIDVLVDINAHFDNARLRLFTYRAAPVQVHYLGGVASTGLQCMDWRIADDLTEPTGSGDSEIGTERIFRVEGGIHTFHPLHHAADPGSLPMGSNGFVTFGCLSALSKIEGPVLDLWARCLKEMPDARLRLVKETFRHEANRVDFSRRAGHHGIDLSRLDLIPGDVSAFNDLSVYHGIDIALDTFPYSGITTTCEALWMGVPVVTLCGNRFVAREASAILTRVGHPEWVAVDFQNYIEVAQSLAANPYALGAIRQNLRAEFMRSPLHDAARLAKEMARFFRQAVIQQKI
jgi:protein O-GlcNAc transferase